MELTNCPVCGTLMYMEFDEDGIVFKCQKCEYKFKISVRGVFVETVKKVSFDMDDIIEETIEKFFEKVKETLEKLEHSGIVLESPIDAIHFAENSWIAFNAELNKAFLEALNTSIEKAIGMLNELEIAKRSENEWIGS